jgi:hypothetical protein
VIAVPSGKVAQERKRALVDEPEVVHREHDGPRPGEGREQLEQRVIDQMLVPARRRLHEPGNGLEQLADDSVAEIALELGAGRTQYFEPL